MSRTMQGGDTLPLVLHGVLQMKVPASASEEDRGDQVLVLRGLRASTVHKDLTLRAIGESGMASAAVFAPTFTTLRELRVVAVFVVFSRRLYVRCFGPQHQGYF